MRKNVILEVPIAQVMRQEIAMPLQQMLKLYTVGDFLRAWRNPRNHRSIEQIFDSPEQARHAVTVCSAWIGMHSIACPMNVPGWWATEPPQTMLA